MQLGTDSYGSSACYYVYCALDGDANANAVGHLNLDGNAYTNADCNANSHDDIDASRALSLPPADPTAVAAAAGLPVVSKN